MYPQTEIDFLYNRQTGKRFVVRVGSNIAGERTYIMPVYPYRLVYVCRDCCFVYYGASHRGFCLNCLIDHYN